MKEGAKARRINQSRSRVDDPDIPVCTAVQLAVLLKIAPGNRAFEKRADSEVTPVVRLLNRCQALQSYFGFKENAQRRRAADRGVMHP